MSNTTTAGYPAYTEFCPSAGRIWKSGAGTSWTFVVVGGVAYVDHPSFGTAIISRLLEAEGYRGGRFWPSPGTPTARTSSGSANPNTVFFIGGGNVDSMVSHYSVAKIPRAEDE